MFFQFLNSLDLTSFLLGFATAVVLSWLIRKITPPLRSAVQEAREKRAANRESVRLTVEYDYRNDFIRYAQGRHLAAPLFPLDEILILPKLLAPSPRTIPGEDNYLTDTLSKILPYMPDYPEFGSVFGAEKLSLTEALKGGANLALMGPPGSGKTVTLAYFGSQVASFSSAAGEFSNFIPFYVQAADLQLPLPEEEDSFNAIYNVLLNADYLSRRTAAGLSNLVQIGLNEKRIFLLLDGLDEISPADIEQVRDFLRSLRKDHPEIRIVAAVSSEFLDGITQLGLHPVTMAGWTNQESCQFIRQWSDRWLENIEGGLWEGSDSGIEHHMLLNWLGQDTVALTPMEITLRTWAVFAGDSLGQKNQHNFDAYLRRMAVNISGAETALERVAMQMVLTQRPVIPQRAAILWSRGQMVDADDEDALGEQIQEMVEDEPSPERVGRSTVGSLIAAGILVERPNEKVGFAHPVLAGYFAGRGFANFGKAGQLSQQRRWSYRQLALHYLAGQAEITPIIEALDRDDLIFTDLLASGRWLRDMDPKSASRVLLMRKLVSIFQDEQQPRILRLRAVAALTFSADPGIGALSKKLISSPDPLTRMMCAFSIGLQRNEKYLPELTQAAADHNFIVRAAACFALANIGSKPAVETVATMLLHGDEGTQRAAAEALAIDPDEGYAFLLEAVKEDDLMLRRSAIYGLARTGQPEAITVIEKLQLEDDQWVVRNTANQEMMRIEQGSPSTPTPFEPLHQMAWLVAFAGESGEGIAPGRAAADMLFKALVQGSIEQRLAAMDYYRLSGSDSVWTALHEILKQAENVELQNAAIQTLWHLRAQGFTTHFAE